MAVLRMSVAAKKAEHQAGTYSKPPQRSGKYHGTGLRHHC
jgi:hypothetical protein